MCRFWEAAGSSEGTSDGSRDSGSHRVPGGASVLLAISGGLALLNAFSLMQQFKSSSESFQGLRSNRVLFVRVRQTTGTVQRSAF